MRGFGRELPSMNSGPEPVEDSRTACEDSAGGGVPREYAVARRSSTTKQMSLFQRSVYA
jgi:hypothetical protein